jgi:hypothetical protein
MTLRRRLEAARAAHARATGAVLRWQCHLCGAAGEVPNTGTGRDAADAWHAHYLRAHYQPTPPASRR